MTNTQTADLLTTIINVLAGLGYTADGAYYDGVTVATAPVVVGGYTRQTRIGLRPGVDGTVEVTDITGAIQFLGHAASVDQTINLIACRGRIAAQAQRDRWSLNQYGFGTAVTGR